MTLGDIIKKYREEHKLSMDDFASLSGISKGYISMLEKNQNPRTGAPIAPSIETYASVAKAMNVTMNSLLEEVGETEKVTIPNSNPKFMKFTSVIQRVINSTSLLNPEGQEIVANTAEGLVASGRYSNKPTSLPFEDSLQIAAYEGDAEGDDELEKSIRERMNRKKR